MPPYAQIRPIADKVNYKNKMKDKLKWALNFDAIINNNKDIVYYRRHIVDIVK